MEVLHPLWSSGRDLREFEGRFSRPGQGESASGRPALALNKHLLYLSSPRLAFAGRKSGVARVSTSPASEGGGNAFSCCCQSQGCFVFFSVLQPACPSKLPLIDDNVAGMW